MPQFDGPLPMFSRLGIAEDPLGGLGRFNPGSQLLGIASGSGPVPGCLGGEGRLAGRLQRLSDSPVQNHPLAGQQPGGDRLGQQGMPCPVLADGSLAYQPGFGEFPKAHANPGYVEFRHTPQLRLGQRPTSYCERREHCPASITATGGPGGICQVK